MLQTVVAKTLKKLRLSSIRGSNVDPRSKIESGSSFYQSSLGRYSFCGYDCEVYHANIGSFTSIANRVVIGGARHPMEWVGMSPVFYKGRDSINKKFSEHLFDHAEITSIGHDVWIGHSAIILSGVKIGNGAVVGAGAIVSKDVSPYCVVAGNPARLIRRRFDDGIISALEEVAWWNFDEKSLMKVAPYVTDPLKFIAVCKELLNR